MTHPERDPDLLLFAHGALQPMQAAFIRWHLIHCSDCRRRLNEFQAASHSLAVSIRDPRMPGWSRPAPDIGTSVLVAWLLGITILLGLLGTLAVQSRRHVPRSSSPTVSMPCRPDLPNDRCR